jgi:hypothetical protein
MASSPQGAYRFQTKFPEQIVVAFFFNLIFFFVVPAKADSDRIILFKVYHPAEPYNHHKVFTDMCVFLK